MDELDAQLSEVEDKIVVEQYKAQNQLKKEEAVEFLTHTIKQQPKLLIKNLIQKIVLYDDRFEIYYNYLNHMPPTEDNPDKIIRELSLSGCSDTSPLCPPAKRAGTFVSALFAGGDTARKRTGNAQHRLFVHAERVLRHSRKPRLSPPS